jgi:hypothetical protein
MNFPTFDRIKSTFKAKMIERQDVHDHIKWQPKWSIARWESKQDYKDQVVYEPGEAEDLFSGTPQFTEIDRNLLCKNGLNNLWKLLATTGGVQYANANAYIGVGTSTTAANIADTALGAGAVYQAMESSYPAISGTNYETCTWRALYGSDAANQAWNEFGIFTSDTGANMLNHVISAQGTKQSGQQWQVDMAITLN